MRRGFSKCICRWHHHSSYSCHCDTVSWGQNAEFLKEEGKGEVEKGHVAQRENTTTNSVELYINREPLGMEVRFFFFISLFLAGAQYLWNE